MTTNIGEYIMYATKGSFRQFTLQNVRAVTEGDGEIKVLGKGRSGFTSVIELKYNGLTCAGKIHDSVIQDDSKSTSVRRFKEECEFLSQVRHPNIVQFLGVYFQKPGEKVPILVMEFLPTNLTSCIRKDDILPNEISYSILHDVALGLCYLHSQTPPIIHRNLNSNNVLLTPYMTAKISDLGMAKILKNFQEDSEMTRSPGDITYMPPEALLQYPKYDTCIDEFSYGILMIHVFSGRLPAPQIEPLHYEPDGTVTIMTEADRRKVFLQVIGTDHPLMDLICKCIHNDPRRRAHASELVKQLEEMVFQFPASFANRLVMLKQFEEDEKKNAAKEEEMQKLRSQITLLQEELMSKMAPCVHSEDKTNHLRQLDTCQQLAHSTTSEKERMNTASSDSPALSNCPKFHELDLIKGPTGTTVRVIKDGASKWRCIATRLYFEGGAIDQISQDSNKDTDQACRTVFSKWLQGENELRTPRTWKTVIEALKEAELCQLAEDLEEVLTGSTSSGYYSHQRPCSDSGSEKPTL